MELQAFANLYIAQGCSSDFQESREDSVVGESGCVFGV